MLNKYIGTLDVEMVEVSSLDSDLSGFWGLVLS
jgi:hypothetical protein